MAKIQAQPISNPRLSFKGWFERSFRWLVHLAALAPFAWTAWLTATGGLTINPIQDLTLPWSCCWPPWRARRSTWSSSSGQH
jgi:hypothetical protein